jgi:O-antigen/teichoic acid export membrane protein
MSFDLRVGLTQGISGVPLSPTTWAMIFGVAVAGYAAYYYYMRRRKA